MLGSSPGSATPSDACVNGGIKNDVQWRPLNFQFGA